MIRLALGLIFCCIMFAASVQAADSTGTVAADSSSVEDSTGVYPVRDTTQKSVEKAVQKFVRLGRQQDSLLALILGSGNWFLSVPDQPQMTSQFDYDPQLYRLSTSSWGEFETVYPLGMAPANLSRSDELFGNESYANPAPLPASEEFIRADIADSYYLLTPTLSGIYSPLGRPFTLYQQRDLPDNDTTLSKIYVIHGRGGFANTTFTFRNRFGPAGMVHADGTFLKKNGQPAYADSRLNRLRIISQPKIAANVEMEVALMMNRLSGSKPFVPRGALLWGDMSDNYTGITGHVDYYNHDWSRYSAVLTYRNDDQQFALENLRNLQRFRQLDASLSHRRIINRHDLEFRADLRYLRFTENRTAHNAVYYNLSAGDLLALSNRLTAYCDLGLKGSSDLWIRPALTMLVRYQIDTGKSLTVIASRGAFLPAPEMQYLKSMSATLYNDTVDYRLAGNGQIESGYSHGMEAVFHYAYGRMKTQVRMGLIRLSNLPQWQVDYSVYANGDYQVAPFDRSLFFASLQSRLSLPYGFYGIGSYALRSVYQSGVDYTYGPQHLASGIVGFRFPINKLKIMVNAALGCKYRSLAARHLDGTSDNATAILESYLSFDLKRFHFFYNYTNLLDINYSLNGLPQPGRSRWWGFTWEFLD